MSKKLLPFKTVFYVTLVLILFSLSCRKADITNSDIAQDKQFTAKFFNLPAYVNPEVQKIANEIKKQDDKYHFIYEFVKKNGLPVWEMLLLILQTKIKLLLILQTKIKLLLILQTKIKEV